MKLLALIAFVFIIPCAFADAASAESLPIDRCGEFSAIIKHVEREIGPRNSVLSLKTNGVGTAAVFLSEKSNTSSEVRWRVVERQGDKGRWCLIGSGNTLELLMDIHTNKSNNKYGLPGSGHKRCAEGMVDSTPSSLSVRMWANQELGKSTIFSLSNGLSARDYILLASHDDHWVLLSRENNNITCYRSRGESLQIFRDYATKASTNTDR